MGGAQLSPSEVSALAAKVVGTATFSEVPGGVRVTLRVNGLTPGEHGFYIHAIRRCEPPDFTSAGAHFNPYGKHHGLANPDGPHAGDFPNLPVGADGTGSLDTIDSPGDAERRL
jgi:superoxide dismutase, Cu-Zn family